MASKKLSITMPSLIAIFSQTLKKTWASMLLSIFVIACTAMIIVCVTALIYYFPLLLGWFNIDGSNILLFRYIWNLVTSLLLFFVGVGAQILMVFTLFNPSSTFKAKILSVKENFWSFLWLTLATYLLAIICSSPIYVSVLFFVVNEIVLAMISLILGLTLLLSLTVYIIFSQFIIIEKKQSWVSAIKQSFKIAEKNLFNVVFNVILIVLFCMAWANLAYTLEFIPVFGVVLSFFALIFLALILFTYLFSMYKEFKNN